MSNEFISDHEREEQRCDMSGFREEVSPCPCGCGAATVCDAQLQRVKVINDQLEF